LREALLVGAPNAIWSRDRGKTKEIALPKNTYRARVSETVNVPIELHKKKDTGYFLFGLACFCSSEDIDEGGKENCSYQEREVFQINKLGNSLKLPSKVRKEGERARGRGRGHEGINVGTTRRGIRL